MFRAGAMIFVHPLHDNFSDNFVFLFFLLVKNNGERKKKREVKNIIKISKIKLYKSSHKIVIQISFFVELCYMARLPFQRICTTHCYTQFAQRIALNIDASLSVLKVKQ